VFRGGSFNSTPRFGRAAYRNRFAPVNRDCFVGFRVVRVR
jgi:formylglycine-generating enzyme required for sulfatase activity